MSRSRTSRPTNMTNLVSRTVLSVVRILIASYFLATATGLVFEPGSRTFLDSVLPQAQAQFATTSYLFITAFAIMVGVAVRPAGLLLAIYIFWSGFLHYDLGGGQEALSIFWRDMALLGAILLIAVTEPGGKTSVRLWSKPVAPRRIARNGETVRPARPSRAATGGMTRDAILSGAALQNVQSPLLPILEFDGAEGDNTDDNLFADIWDGAKPAVATA